MHFFIKPILEIAFCHNTSSPLLQQPQSIILIVTIVIHEESKIPSGSRIVPLPQIRLEIAPMIVTIAIPRHGAPAAGRALVEAGAVDHAVLHRGRPDNGQLLGALASLVVDAAYPAERLFRVGDVVEGVVGGGAGLALGDGGGCGC